MKKVLILLIFLLGCSFLSYSQSRMTDVVYLKNGSIIRGIIVEQVPNQSMKVRTSDGSIFNFGMNEIEKITKEEAVRQKSAFFSSTDENIEEYSGKFRGIVDLGYIAGGIKGPEFCFSLGGQINKFLFLGAGAGVEYATDLETVVIPIFADIRGYLMTGPIVPFIALRAGYSVVPEYSGGFYCHPFAGVRFRTSGKKAVSLALGWSTNKYKIWYYSAKSNALTLKIGYEF